ncbi:NAD(P)-dependent oxidoreductase [Xanthomonas axonopodis pv. ricini]|uniref:NAD(P)-dependent oxidoreductase n=1 Tax=Xanthomonas euvesicatoria TaxID=456327 RepID=UPI002458B5D4|nr:NAD(P)-dependent oxidoreductase [Xanthomonas euvesicatoria]MDH4910125.1 NAD(P)-dependent oxidoreductase [Xanthomonas euvesicatoria]
MSKITVLGLGAMGSRMAANLIKAGHAVTVWNRSPAAAEALVAAGAALAATPREAAAGADFVMAMVRDDRASRQVWLDPDTGALAGMAAGAIALESSTLTLGWIRELGAQAALQRIALLEAPVSGSTPQAEAAQLVYLVGGEADTLTHAAPILKAMGSAIQHVGPLGSGALAKLTTNTLLGIQVAVLGELVGMLQHSGADVARVLDAVATTPVWSPVAGRISGSMLAGSFAPQFPIELIEKDFGYTVQAAGSDVVAPTIAAARSVFLAAIERGLGGENMTAVVKLFAEQVPAR